MPGWVFCYCSSSPVPVIKSPPYTDILQSQYYQSNNSLPPSDFPPRPDKNLKMAAYAPDGVHAARTAARHSASLRLGRKLLPSRCGVRLPLETYRTICKSVKELDPPAHTEDIVG